MRGMLTCFRSGALVRVTLLGGRSYSSLYERNGGCVQFKRLQLILSKKSQKNFTIIELLKSGHP